LRKFSHVTYKYIADILVQNSQSDISFNNQTAIYS